MTLSIIICSRTHKISKDLSENIKNTVGCDYQLIIIDNSENTYSIYEAYNLGISKSNGEYMCFIHDDILFHTIGWGSILNTIFNKNLNIGLIGVAGAKFKTKMPSVWWYTPEDQKAMYIIQHLRDGTIVTQSYGFKESCMEEVVTIDGVFMALRKSTNIVFNTQLKGFHNYDLNLSFESLKNGYKIVVTNLIKIEHFSPGDINDSWIDSTYVIHNLYKDILPLSISGNNKNKKFEVENAKRFINKCLNFNDKKKAFSIWKRLVKLKPYSKFHYKFIRNIIKTTL